MIYTNMSGMCKFFNRGSKAQIKIQGHYFNSPGIINHNNHYDKLNWLWLSKRVFLWFNSMSETAVDKSYLCTNILLHRVNIFKLPSFLERLYNTIWRKLFSSVIKKTPIGNLDEFRKFTVSVNRIQPIFELWRVSYCKQSWLA